MLLYFSALLNCECHRLFIPGINGYQDDKWIWLCNVLTNGRRTDLWAHLYIYIYIAFVILNSDNVTNACTS